MQSLALNPKTYTPEFLLFVARVLEIKDAPAGMEVTVQLFKRPGVREDMFSVGGADAEEEIDNYDWASILDSKWRIVEL